MNEWPSSPIQVWQERALRQVRDECDEWGLVLYISIAQDPRTGELKPIFSKHLSHGCVVEELRKMADSIETNGLL